MAADVKLPDEAEIDAMGQLKAKQEATRLLRVIEGSPHNLGEIDPALQQMTQLQAKNAVRELTASIRASSPESSPLLRSRSVERLQVNGASSLQQQPSAPVITNGSGMTLLNQAKANGLAHRWVDDAKISANYLAAPTAAGYANLIKKMLHSSVIGSFTSSLGTILSTGVNAANIGTYGGASNLVYASDAKDPKFMGRAFKHYIDEQLATPGSALANAVTQAATPALTRPYVSYKEMIRTLRDLTKKYFANYFVNPAGYAYDNGVVKITVNDLANTVADMVYQSLKVNSEEQLLPATAAAAQVQIPVASSPRAAS